eukprot:TRINITY_DN5813_c0_g1_i9.p1 TRINITY_DN5813_c0_g1~~TRINITY_DN5813_c0_g1_i9.p1  ORF type:complete len:283 (+),score=49.79 TRINITY_DN5813_c0_g1_i9:42-890(+)
MASRELLATGGASRVSTAMLSVRSEGINKRSHLHFSRSPQSFAYFRQQHKEYNLQTSQFPQRSGTIFPPIAGAMGTQSISVGSEDEFMKSSQQGVYLKRSLRTSELEQNATKIQRWYRCIRDRLVFRQMKTTLRAAEKAITLVILRQLNMNESRVVNDPCTPCIVRLRFLGICFPPKLVYKIYLKQKVHTFDPDDYFAPNSPGLRDAMRLMGPRAFTLAFEADKEMFSNQKTQDLIQKGWRPLYDLSLAYNKVSRSDYEPTLPPVRTSFSSSHVPSSPHVRG